MFMKRRRAKAEGIIGIRIQAITSEEGENIRQDLQGDPRAGDRKEYGRIFRQDSKSKCQDVVEGSAFLETEKMLLVA
jgi:hypothetical protein